MSINFNNRFSTNTTYQFVVNNSYLTQTYHFLPFNMSPIESMSDNSQKQYYMELTYNACYASMNFPNRMK